MSALGYQQLSASLVGEISLDDAIQEIKKVTKKFYRRQMTWFKLSDEQINWFEMSASTEEKVEKLISKFISD